MRLPAHIFGLIIAAVLLIIAIPYGLVQLDLLAAGRLRLVPSAIAVAIAVAFIAAVLTSRRRRKRP